MAKLYALPGYALVELGSKYENLGSVPTKAYDGATNGTLLDFKYVLPAGLSEDDRDTIENIYSEAIGKRVYWEELVTGTRVTVDGKEYVMPKLTDLRAYGE